MGGVGTATLSEQLELGVQGMACAEEVGRRALAPSVAFRGAQPELPLLSAHSVSCLQGIREAACSG